MRGRALSGSPGPLRGEVGLHQDDLEQLLDCYRASKRRRVELLDSARNAEQRGWLRNAHPPGDRQSWPDFEDEASALLNHEPLTIPGMLQTSEYARAIIEATGEGLSTGQVDELVAGRTARRGLSDRADPVRFHAIVEEAVSIRPFGDEGALPRQLRYPADAAERPHITVQVIHTGAGLHSGLNGTSALLEHDDEPSLVWVENKLASVVLDEDEQIDACLGTWEELAKLAWGPDESVDLLRQLATRGERCA